MEDKGGNLVPNGEKISFSSEHLITATGNHSQVTAKKLGIKIPAIPETTLLEEADKPSFSRPNQLFCVSVLIRLHRPFLKRSAN